MSSRFTETAVEESRARSRAVWYTCSGAAVLLTVVVCKISFTTLWNERTYEQNASLAAIAEGATSTRSWSPHPNGAYLIAEVALRTFAPSYWALGLRFVSGASFILAWLILTKTALEVSAETARKGPLTTIAVCAVSLAFFCVPLLLIHAAATDCEAVGFLVQAAFLWCGVRWMRTGRWAFACAWLALAMAMSASHAYGAIYATSGAVALLVISFRGDSPRGTRSLAVVAGTIILGMVWLNPELWPTLNPQLLDNYWALYLAPRETWFPLAILWREASFLWYGSFLFSATMQVLTLAILALLLLSGNQASATVAAQGAALSLLWFVTDRSAAAPIYVPQMGGATIIVFAVAWSVAIASIRLPIAQGISIAAILILSLGPALWSIATIRFDGREAVREAVSILVREAANADSVVFGGSRCYFLFYPYLPSSMRSKSFIYLRTGAMYDNFPGRRLLPKQRCLDEEGIDDLKAQSIVFVQVQAAQTIQFPGNGWQTAVFESVPYRTFTVLEIDVLRLVRSSNEPSGI